MSMPESMERLFADAAAKLSVELPEGHVAYYDQTPVKITKHSGFIPLSEDQLMDAGIIPDTRPPVYTSWRTRLRWRWAAWRERIGRRVGGWIAGVDLRDSGDLTADEFETIATNLYAASQAARQAAR